MDTRFRTRDPGWGIDLKDRKQMVLPRWRRRPRVKSFGRAMEARLSKLGRGHELVEAIQRNRVVIVSVLRHTEGRRAAAALFKPLAGAVTTDDVLHHEISKHDLENVARLLAVTERVAGDGAKHLIEVARSLAERAQKSRGITIGKLMD